MPTQIAFSQRKIENTFIVIPTSSKRFKKQFKFQGLTKAYEKKLMTKASQKGNYCHRVAFLWR